MDSQQWHTAAWKRTRWWSPAVRERRDKIERKKREREEEERLVQLKLSTSHANWTGTTGEHVVKGTWATSRAQQVAFCGMTQSHQKNQRDSR
jgi:hypothetical protein